VIVATDGNVILVNGIEALVIVVSKAVSVFVVVGPYVGVLAFGNAVSHPRVLPVVGFLFGSVIYLLNKDSLFDLQTVMLFKLTISK
jgi:hypothetical protein